MTLRRPGDRPPLGLRLLVGEAHGLLLQPAHHLTQAGLALAPPHPAGLLLGVGRQVEPRTEIARWELLTRSKVLDESE